MIFLCGMASELTFVRQ